MFNDRKAFLALWIPLQNEMIMILDKMDKNDRMRHLLRSGSSSSDYSCVLSRNFPDKTTNIIVHRQQYLTTTSLAYCSYFPSIIWYLRYDLVDLVSYVYVFATTIHEDVPTDDKPMADSILTRMIHYSAELKCNLTFTNNSSKDALIQQ